MAFNTSITINPRDPLAKPTVQSSLVSRRALGSPWRTQRQGQVRADRTTNVVGQLQRQINNLNILGQTALGLHPFQLYNYPKPLRTISHDDDWRRVKVHNGLVIIGTSSFYPKGSDGAGSAKQGFASYGDYEGYTFPYTLQQNSESGTDFNENWNEFIVPDDGSVYYFWLSRCFGNNPTVDPEIFVAKDEGTTPLIDATSMYDGNPVFDIWPSFPANDPYHFLIAAAYVDNGEFSGTPQLVIRQYQKDDIQLLVYGSNSQTYLPDWTVTPRYMGDWDTALYYFIGDIVNQTLTVSGKSWLYQWMFYPPEATAYPIAEGPIQSIDPSDPANTPDPWRLISKSPIDAEYQTGAFVPADYYLRA